jgi:hypothetical protein
VRAALQGIDPNLAVENAETMTQKIEEQTSGLRYIASLMGVFGGIALVLTVIGIYGVIAQLVNERAQEIGIRMALGAQAKDVMSMVMRSGLFLLASGVTIGIAFSPGALPRDCESGVWTERVGFPGICGCAVVVDGRDTGGTLPSGAARDASGSGHGTSLLVTAHSFDFQVRNRTGGLQRAVALLQVPDGGYQGVDFFAGVVEG